MSHPEEKEEKKENWPAIRDLFDQIIIPTKNWEDATLVATREEMGIYFSNAFPDVRYSYEDLQLALHDLGIQYERNEYNNKYYYIAAWR